MTARQIYFIKQKFMGVLWLVLAALSVRWLDGDATVALLFSIPSLALIFSKKMWIMDDYYIRVMKSKRKTKRL